MSQFVTIGEGVFALSLRLPKTGMPEILNFGSETSGLGDLQDVARASRINGMDEAVPSAVILPVGGGGFFGWPALAGHRAGRDFTLQFANWKVEYIGQRVELRARDNVTGIDLSITLEAFSSGVLSISSCITNVGEDEYMLDRCMAASILIPENESTVTSFAGMWGREFQTRKEILGNGIWLRENRRGRTSHDCPPIVSFDRAEGGLTATLGWSGNHCMVIDKLDDGRRILHLGELFEPGEIILSSGESYSSPTAYVGPNADALHAFVRKDLVDWPGRSMRPRPVTLNTWEGNYFDHRVESLKEQASVAAAIGIERFVLDDGWFGVRDDDTTSLGDWDIDPRKYPDGLKPIVDHVTSLGMEFGIWFEPEMVNPISSLYKQHPDWAMQVNGRPTPLSRNQLVLDLTRPEVIDYLFNKMDAVLSAHSVSYIKWDMNRDLTFVGGQTGRAVTSAQTKAVYALMDRIRNAHPEVEIETCASGGGRVDYGVLKRTHRVWTSDCTDALERLEIQRGVSSILPPELVGSHVSASPNHQTGRRHTLAFRAIVALAYHFGVELNPATLSKAEQDELADFISTHKRLRNLLHKPEANFRADPVDGRYMWGAADEDRIALFVAQGPQMVNEHPSPLLLPGWVAALGGHWRIARMQPSEPAFTRMSHGQKKMFEGGVIFDVNGLDRTGLPLPMLQPESAILLEIERVEGEPDNG